MFLKDNFILFFWRQCQYLCLILARLCINYDDLDVQPAEPLDRDLAEQSMVKAANKTINETTNINNSFEAWMQANI